MSAVSAEEQCKGEILWGVRDPVSPGLSCLRTCREPARAPLFCLWNAAHAVIASHEFPSIDATEPAAASTNRVR
jgi:hypothetical protein